MRSDLSVSSRSTARYTTRYARYRCDCPFVLSDTYRCWYLASWEFECRTLKSIRIEIATCGCSSSSDEVPKCSDLDTQRAVYRLQTLRSDRTLISFNAEAWVNDPGVGPSDPTGTLDYTECKSHSEWSVLQLSLSAAGWLVARWDTVDPYTRSVGLPIVSFPWDVYRRIRTLFKLD